MWSKLRPHPNRAKYICVAQPCQKLQVGISTKSSNVISRHKETKKYTSTAAAIKRCSAGESPMNISIGFVWVIAIIVGLISGGRGKGPAQNGTSDLGGTS
jgi:hypothetical protein